MNGIIRMVFFSLCFLFNCHQKWLLVFYSIFNFQWIPVNIYWCRWLFEKKTNLSPSQAHTNTRPLTDQCCCCFIFIHFFGIWRENSRKKKIVFVLRCKGVCECFWLLFRLFAIQYLMISIHKNRYLLLIGVCTNEWRTHSQYNTI